MSDRPRRSDRRKDDRGSGSSKDFRKGHKKEGGPSRPTPVILAKPPTANREEEFPTLQQAHQDSRKSPVGSGNEQKRPVSPVSGISGAVASMVLLGRKNSSGNQTPAAPSDSPGAPAKNPDNAGGKTREKSVRLIDDQLQFCTGTLAGVLTENSDFLVVGVIGMQGVGKSSLLNHLCNYMKVTKNKEEELEQVKVFREQTFEKQMMGEHGTNGVKAWVSPTSRVIFLDSQPLNSVSLLDRAMQIADKKHNAEFSTSEATVEIQSLQIAAFLMTVCHVLVAVQDQPFDTNLVDFLQTAEMLKPSSPALAGSGLDNEPSGQMVEYFPDLVFLHNKARLGDHVKHSAGLLERCMVKSQLKYNSGKVSMLAEPTPFTSVKSKYQMGQLNMFLVPEYYDDFDEAVWAFKSETCFGEAVGKFRRKVMSVQPSNLTTCRLTEKSWLNFAQKSWENVRNSPFYVEFSRMLN